MLFDDRQPINPIPLTKEIGDLIYLELRQKKEKENVFSDGVYSIDHISQVWDEVKRLENLANSVMYKEDVSGKEELLSYLSSDIISLTPFIDDYIDYTLDYEANTSREDFKNQFIKDVG